MVKKQSTNCRRHRRLGFDPLEEEMATPFSIPTWKIPWTEPSGLQSMGLQRVRHDLETEHTQRCNS